ncbi:MAG TPA: carboxylating nicotinate-nucleotide diphosphorylase [Candidatus Methylacidiphilales bacterium]|nr:carboxylating nicotinate-nucleotide diphosphorylase [Candidatus Methylacidiphilales bacterium]
MPPHLDPVVIREAAVRALGEDRGPADITTFACIPPEARASARIFAKEPCVLAGLLVAEQVFREQDAFLVLTPRARDGDSLESGATVLELHGSAASILTGERSALNFLQQLSGVATETRRYVEAVAGTRAQILDTRKTAPGLRALQKYAVVCGGGSNHRFGLYDRFLIKDNHLALMNRGCSLVDAVKKARALDPQILLEIEVSRPGQIPEMIALGADIILLDNMTAGEIRACVDLIAGRAKTEASGNMSLSRVAEVAATGVDYISVGALTHSVRAIDFSLDII